MTAALRSTLAAALALGLAAAPAAQQAVDADVPGAATAALARAPDAAPGTDLRVDDRDPGSAPSVAPDQAAQAEVSDQDADAPARPLPRALDERAVSPGAPLNDGRDGAVALRIGEAKAAYDGPLRDGREDGVGSLQLRAPYTGPLNDGRGDTDAPAVDPQAAAPVVAAAPLAAARAAPEGLALSLVRPNPARDRAELTFTLEVGGSATVRVFDVQGREVAVAYDAPSPAGSRQTVVLDVASLAPGTYVAVLTATGRTASQTFQVVR